MTVALSRRVLDDHRQIFTFVWASESGPYSTMSLAKEEVFPSDSFYEKADRCQGTLLGLLFVP